MMDLKIGDIIWATDTKDIILITKITDDKIETYFSSKRKILIFQKAYFSLDPVERVI